MILLLNLTLLSFPIALVMAVRPAFRGVAGGWARGSLFPHCFGGDTAPFFLRRMTKSYFNLVCLLSAGLGGHTACNRTWKVSCNGRVSTVGQGSSQEPKERRLLKSKTDSLLGSKMLT